MAVKLQKNLSKGDQVMITSGDYKGQSGKVKEIKQKGFKKTKGWKRSGKVAVLVEGVRQLPKFRRKIVYNGETVPGDMSYVDREIDISNIKKVEVVESKK
jgi:ribosomal protein L24